MAKVIFEFGLNEGASSGFVFFTAIWTDFLRRVVGFYGMARPFHPDAKVASEQEERTNDEAYDCSAWDRSRLYVRRYLERPVSRHARYED